MNKLKLLIHSILSITIACICILFFIQNSNAEFNLLVIINTILDGWFYLVLACTLLVISVYCRVYRWEYLFDSTQVKSSNILLRSQFIGYFIRHYT